MRQLIDKLRKSSRGAGTGAPDFARATGFEPIDENESEQRPSMLTVEALGPTAVATVCEPELSGPAVHSLAVELRSLAEERPATKNLVVDLQNVEFLDSICLNMLINLLKSFQSRGGRIAVCSAKEHVEGMFRLTRLDKLFPVKRDTLSAIAAVEAA